MFMKSTLHVRVSVFIILSLACTLVWVLPYFGYAESSAPEFTVTFLDVGQGDAILVQTPEGIEVLIDGGRGDQVLTELAAVLGAFDRTINMVVATHPDADHIGGLIAVLDRYDVEHILITENKGESAVAKTFFDRVTAEEANIVHARAGQRFTIGASTTIDVLFPFATASEMENNASSIVLKITYGESEVLLTGDAPKHIELYLVDQYGDSLSSEILKAGHHGSRTSSDELFVKTVTPMYGVISAGAENSYGHPHQEVLEIFSSENIETVTTMQGRVTFTSDGSVITLE